VIDAISASSSAYDVSMTHAISGIVDRISRQTSTPRQSGTLAHDSYVVVLLEQRSQTRPDDRMVIDENHAQRHGRHLSIGD
jgi:hypothetical protein